MYWGLHNVICIFLFLRVKFRWKSNSCFFKTQKFFSKNQVKLKTKAMAVTHWVLKGGLLFHMTCLQYPPRNYGRWSREVEKTELSFYIHIYTLFLSLYKKQTISFLLCLCSVCTFSPCDALIMSCPDALFGVEQCCWERHFVLVGDCLIGTVQPLGLLLALEVHTPPSSHGWTVRQDSKISPETPFH